MGTTRRKWVGWTQDIVTNTGVPFGAGSIDPAGVKQPKNVKKDPKNGVGWIATVGGSGVEKSDDR